MLSREDIVAVASRIFAIFLFVITLRLISPMLTALAQQEWPLWLVAISVLFLLVPLGIASLLWFFPLTVARKLLPVMKDSAPTESGRPVELEVLAFSVLGAWVLASALSDATYWFMFALAAKNPEFENVRFSAENVASMVATGIELLVGFYLLFGARGLVGLLRRFRHAGANIPQQEDSGEADQPTESTHNRP